LQVAYESAVEWGYEQQSALFKAQDRIQELEKEVATLRSRRVKTAVATA
jgi:hypothetical protein